MGMDLAAKIKILQKKRPAHSGAGLFCCVMGVTARSASKEAVDRKNMNISTTNE